MAKKLSEMTPYERVKPRLKGLSNEEAEEIAITILSQTLAKHLYIHGNENHLEKLFHTITERAGEYIREHSLEMAAAKVYKEKYMK